jgi:glutamate 5-kinase
MISAHIQNAEIIVIKVGSSLLIKDGQLNQAVVERARG